MTYLLESKYCYEHPKMYKIYRSVLKAHDDTCTKLLSKNNKIYYSKEKFSQKKA